MTLQSFFFILTDFIFDKPFAIQIHLRNCDLDFNSELQEMGVTFGQMEGLEMPYERIGSRCYEMRKYAPYFVAEISCKDEELKDACATLERYIGRFCEPENIKGNHGYFIIHFVSITLLQFRPSRFTNRQHFSANHQDQ